MPSSNLASIPERKASGSGELVQPTLYLHGSEDGCMGVEVAESVRTLSPWAEVRIIEGAGHFLQLERPDEVAAAVLGWVS